MIRVSQLYLNKVGPFISEKFDFSVEEGHPDIHIFTGQNGSGKTTMLHSIASSFDFFENDHKENTSNLLYKRFHKFNDDQKTMPESYVHCILRQSRKSKVVDKISIYGCKHCGNIHQNYEKTVNNSDAISRNGKNYQQKPHSGELLKYKNAIVAKTLENKSFEFAAFGYSSYRLIRSSHISIDNNDLVNPLHLALEFVKDKNTGFLVSNWMVSRYSKSAIERMKGNDKLADKYMLGVKCLQNAIAELTNDQIKFEIETNPWQVLLMFNGKQIEFDVLPDGLRSLLSWLGDLLMRLDSIPWKNDSIAVNEQNIILLLDEIEVHLHPKWQYHILPITKKLFPKAQIFLSTHSPFVINSIDNAKIHILEPFKGNSRLKEVKLSNTGDSYSSIYENILETTQTFGKEAMDKLNEFKKIEKEIIKQNFDNEDRFANLIDELKDEGEEVMDIVHSHIHRVNRISGKNYLEWKK